MKKEISNNSQENKNKLNEPKEKDNAKKLSPKPKLKKCMKKRPVAKKLITTLQILSHRSSKIRKKDFKNSNG